MIKIQVFQRGQGFNVRTVLSHTLLVTHSVIKYLWGRHVNGDMEKWPDLIRMKMSISQKNRILFLLQENSYQKSSLVCNSLSLLLLLLSQTSCYFILKRNVNYIYLIGWLAGSNIIFYIKRQKCLQIYCHTHLFRVNCEFIENTWA